MPHIVRKEWKRDTSYYIYDNIFIPEKKGYMKKYIGKATESEYKQYIEDQKNRIKKNYCQKCKRRFPSSLPIYMRQRFELCECGKNVV